MVVLTKQEVSKYEGVSASAIKGVSLRTEGKLKAMEIGIKRPLLGYIVSEIHQQGRSVSELAKEMGVAQECMRQILKKNDVPTPSHEEALERIIAQKKGIYGATPEQQKKWNQAAGMKTLEKKVGICGATHEERVAWGTKGSKTGSKMGGNAVYEKKVGIFGATTEDLTAWGKKGGKTVYDTKVGIYNATQENLKKWSETGGRKTLEIKVGIYGGTPEEIK